jgi:hypothetical protein
MDADTRDLFSGWKLNNPIAYLQAEIEGLKIARESSSSPEEIQYIDKHIADIEFEIMELRNSGLV